MLLLILVLTGFAMTVFAQADPQVQTEDKEQQQSYLYQWTDDKGIVHITDSLGMVPKQYRDKAIKLKQPKKDNIDQGHQVQQESTYPSGAESDAADAVVKREWQERLRERNSGLTTLKNTTRDSISEGTSCSGAGVVLRTAGSLKALRSRKSIRRLRMCRKR